MGLCFVDKYSLLHFAVGIIIFYWNVPFLLACVIHTVFEIVENTSTGMYIINTYISNKGYFSWPGGKPYPDTVINSIGDTVFFAIGWGIANQFN